MMKIKRIVARHILDSRGTPTVEAEVWLESGVFGRAAAPSGASTGAHEAHELRDGGKDFFGKGVSKAVANANGEIAAKLKGKKADDQAGIDQVMLDLDGTDNKENLGANAILAVSLACAHAAAAERKVPLYKHINDLANQPNMSLPMPMMNVLNGGKHATNSSDFQESMIIPLAAQSMAEAVQIGSEIFMALKKVIVKNKMSTAVGDEGGFTYPVDSNGAMMNLLNQAVEQAGYQLGKEVAYAIDAAASEFFDDGVYNLKCEGKKLDAKQMIDYLQQLAKEYPLISIEDGLDEDQWEDWSELTKQLADVQLVGDDILVTNTKRLQRAIDEKAGNSILVKPNQIGTLTETIQTVQLAQQHGWGAVVSHRSGETEDITIAHIATGLGAGQIKTGSLSRSDRTAKYNELMRIESSDSSLKLANPFN